MRLARLDLERYGPFSGRGLDFSPEARLHVVYGPNEAGKSSALEAITDLLFGFEHRISQDFLHRPAELRVGARLVAANGAEISFARKRNKPKLVDADDQPLPDDALLPFLGGLSREVFTRAFGLSTEGLRSGAEEMLKSEGDLGAALFAAASGLKGLNELRRGLEQEADTIFAPRASQNRRFYQALTAQDEARKAIRESELKAGDWKKLNDEIAELKARLEEIARDRRAAVAESTRLDRLKRVAPCLRLIDEGLRDLAALGQVPALPAGFAGQLEDRLAAADAARAELRRAGEAVERATEAHGRIGVDETLLSRADEIGDLVSRSGACAKDRVDLPRVQAEVDQKTRTLEGLAVRLGLGGSDRLQAAQPSDAVLAGIAELAEQGAELARARQSTEASLTSARADLATLRQARDAQGALVDPRPLQERLAALEPDLRVIATLPEAETAAEAKARELREAVGRLRPAADLAVLASHALPSLETVDKFREDLASLARDEQDCRSRREEAQAEVSRLERDIAVLRTGRPVPSAEAIAEVRARRDDRWRGLRERLFGRADSSPHDLPDEVAQFERVSDEADRLADEAARDAGRVERHALAVANLETQSGLLAELDRRLATLRERYAACHTEWTALWAGVTDAPRAPAEMAEWLRQVGGLLERREAQLKAQDAIATLRKVEMQLRPALADLANAAGAAASPGGGAVLLGRAVAERLKALAHGWDEARDVETRRRDVEHRIGQLEARDREEATQFADWQARWRAAVPALGLDAEIGIAEAEAARQAWREVPAAMSEWEDRRRRVAGMQRDIGIFETRLGALVQAVCPDLAGAAPDAALQGLRDRLEAAKAARTRRAEAAVRLEEASEGRGAAEAECRRAEAALAELAANFPPDADLSAEHARLVRREALEAQLAERRRQLAEQGDGHDEAQLREELAGFDADAAAARVAELQAEAERLDVVAREVHSACDRAIERRQALEAGVGAELAAMNKASAESELAAAAREWLVLKLGSLLVSGAVERHRAGQQDPLMARAGELFATLTGGRFEALAQDYDESDTPRLVGRRCGEDRPVPIPGMSEGTRDQLYLALRLAYLEDYARRAEPVPFIGDDLFSTFDDARTAHGLEVLAGIGARVQPILFTHHARVAELAAGLGPSVQLLELP